MSDLISRSELIKELNKYCGNQRYLVSENIREIINNQPNAYSVEKVVEKLEEIRAKKTCNKEKCDTKDLCRICVVDDAIEIVKQGGVSDDVCEWKKSKDYPFDWLVGCDGCEVNHRQGDYCPRCGKKIKAVW